MEVLKYVLLMFCLYTCLCVLTLHVHRTATMGDDKAKILRLLPEVMADHIYQAWPGASAEETQKVKKHGEKVVLAWKNFQRLKLVFSSDRPSDLERCVH